MPDKFTGIYRAKVLDRDDPLKAGRIKAEIYPMLVCKETAKKIGSIDGADVDDIPWAKPAFPLFSGSKGEAGSFMVPEIDSFVFVFFEAGDIYQPVYFAEAATAIDGLPSERLENYPDVKVFKAKSGIKIIIDEIDEKISVEHPSSSSISIDKEGNISVLASGNVTINSDRDTEIKSSGDITISGKNVRINP